MICCNFIVTCMAKWYLPVLYGTKWWDLCSNTVTPLGILSNSVFKHYWGWSYVGSLKTLARPPYALSASHLKLVTLKKMKHQRIHVYTDFFHFLRTWPDNGHMYFRNATHNIFSWNTKSRLTKQYSESFVKLRFFSS